MVSLKKEIWEGVGILKISNTPYHFMTSDLLRKMDLVLRDWGKRKEVKAIIICNMHPGYFITHYSLEEILNGGRIVNRHSYLSKPIFASVIWNLMRLINVLNKGGWVGKSLVSLFEQTNMGNAVVAMNRMNNLYNYLEYMPKPVIAAIGGDCMGGGLELALCCDFRIMARSNYKMGLIEILINTIPGGGGTQRLLKMIGVARTKEIVLTGKRIGADEAERLGIVTKAVDEDALMKEALQLANKLGKTNPNAIKYAKETILRGQHLPINRAIKSDVLGFLATIGDQQAMKSCVEYEKDIAKGKHSKELFEEMDKA
jgi:enoyl-CoA hydratase/carnithine racemase